MRYLCRLITPPNGTVLDPFMGSGTTVLMANQMNRNAIGIEIIPEYYNNVLKIVGDDKQN